MTKLIFGELDLWPEGKLVNVNQDKLQKLAKHFVVTLYLGHTHWCMGQTHWCMGHSLSLGLFFLVFLGLHLRYLEVPRLGVVAAGLYHSHSHARSLNPLSKARDRTCILMNTSQICFPWATVEAPWAQLYLIWGTWKVRNSQLSVKDSFIANH